MLYLFDLTYLQRESWYLYYFVYPEFQCYCSGFQTCYCFDFQILWGLAVLRVLLESQEAGLQNWEQKY